MNKKYYISTAIAYTSGKPHIGNTYEIVLADSIARYRRMQGYDVYFQTGTDEHGEKIQQKAKAAGITPQQYVDNVAAQVKNIWDTMNTTYDKFVRTTDKEHERKVQRIFEKLYEQGDIYKGAYEGMYCTPCESFFTESQLVNGRCPDCGGEVKKAKEEAYFFKLSKYADRLEKYINDHPDFIQPPARKNEMINNFIKPGISDLCVTRSTFNWGIPVTFDAKHVIYVWIDALSNYITNIGYDPDGNHSEQYKKYWPADMHLIGKDIVRFHTIYWPILLMALDQPLPKQVFGHPWLIMSDGKMSKSKGNVIYADDLVRLFGVDAVRYFLLHEIPFANDGLISYELIIERINSELANILGNLVNRTISMSRKYFGGVVSCGKSAPVDDELRAVALETPKTVKKHMEANHIADAIDDIFTLLRRANKYIDETEPWVLGREGGDSERLRQVLYNLVESIRFAAVLLEPFMPDTSKAIHEQLNLKNLGLSSLESFGAVEDGHVLGENSILFARIDAEKMLEEINEQNAKSQQSRIEKPKTEEIKIDDFAKVSLCAAKIISCEKLKKSDKLLVLQVDNGYEQKQILSGIAQYYTPDQLIGKTVALVDNLAPAKLRGETSEGMLLACDTPDGVRVVFLDDSIPAGSKIR